MQPDQAVFDRWSGAAPFWEKHRDVIRQMFAPVTQALVDDARIGGGYAVLDIATGPGEPALNLARAVGPTGKVTATDLSEAMLAALRSNATAEGMTNVETRRCDAQQLPFADAEFDAVVCQFGLMFVPDKALAAREAHRVLKPGGLFLFNVWDAIEYNDLPRVARKVVTGFFEDNPPDFYDVPFSFCDPDCEFWWRDYWVPRYGETIGLEAAAGFGGGGVRDVHS